MRRECAFERDTARYSLKTHTGHIVLSQHPSPGRACLCVCVCPGVSRCVPVILKTHTCVCPGRASVCVCPGVSRCVPVILKTHTRVVYK